LTNGDDGRGGEAPVETQLVADSLDYDTVLPTLRQHRELATVFTNVLLVSGIPVLAPIMFVPGSIIISVTVAKSNQEQLAAMFTHCQFCFEWEGFNICPRPAKQESCSKSGFTSIEKAMQEQEALEAAEATKSAKTTATIVPVIAIVLFIAVVCALLVAKRRVTEAKDREDERELSALKDGSGKGRSRSSRSSSSTCIEATTLTSLSAASARKQGTRAMLDAVADEGTYGEVADAAPTTLADYAEAGPAQPSLSPATLSLSSDCASIRLVSTRRANPLYAAAAPSQPVPVYDQGVAGEASYNAANLAAAPYAYSEGVPLYTAAGAGGPAAAEAAVGALQATYALADAGAGAGTATYAVAFGGGEAGMPLCVVPADAAAKYDVAASATAVAYGVAAPAEGAAEAPHVLGPPGAVLYAVADNEAAVLAAATSTTQGDGIMHSGSRRGSAAGDVEGLGMNHMPGQPLRRSNSYGNALNEMPDSPEVPDPDPDTFRVVAV